MLRRTHLYIFLGIVISFISLLSFVAYEALATAFHIVDSGSLRLLFVLVFGLSWSFILANIQGNYFYNFITRSYYRVTAVWTGFLCYLFLAALLYAAFIAMLQDAVPAIGQNLILAACLVTLYGVIHARNVQVKKIKVSMPNIPHAWKSKSAVWVSDLHLGQVYGREFLFKVVDKINTIAPEVLFIGGDLFDGTQAPDLDRLISPLAYIDKTTEVYFITGNHEEFGDSSPFLRSVRELGIKVLSDEMVEVDGMQIIGVDYRNTVLPEGFRSILAGLGIDKTKPSILLKHEPKDIHIAEEAGISLQLSGHTHRAQVWPLHYVARVVYKKYEYGLKRFKNMWVHTSSGVGSWGPPVRVGSDSEVIHITFE